MENETLFNEEAEPPGPTTGLVVVQNKTTNFFSLTTNAQHPSPAKSKPERLYFPFKDSPRSRAFRKNITPTSAASNGLTGGGSFKTPFAMYRRWIPSFISPTMNVRP